MNQTMLFVIFLMTCASGTETLYSSIAPLRERANGADEAELAALLESMIVPTVQLAEANEVQPSTLPSAALRRLYHAEEARLWEALAEGQPWPQLPGNHNADPVLLDPVQTFFDQVDELHPLPFVPLPAFQRMPTFDSESENQSSAGNAQATTSVPAPRTKRARQPKAHVQSKPPLAPARIEIAPVTGKRKYAARPVNAWTPEMDAELLRLVQLQGTRVRGWTVIADSMNDTFKLRGTTYHSHAKGLVDKTVRQRWHYQVNPEIDSSQWSQEERAYLTELHAEMGNKWADISRTFWAKGWHRTDNDVKNHAHNMNLTAKRKKYSSARRVSLTASPLRQTRQIPGEITFHEPANPGPATPGHGTDDQDMPKRVLFQDFQACENAGLCGSTTTQADDTLMSEADLTLV